MAQQLTLLVAHRTWISSAHTRSSQIPVSPGPGIWSPLGSVVSHTHVAFTHTDTCTGTSIHANKNKTIFRKYIVWKLLRFIKDLSWTGWPQGHKQNTSFPLSRFQFSGGDLKGSQQISLSFQGTEIESSRLLDLQPRNVHRWHFSSDICISRVSSLVQGHVFSVQMDKLSWFSLSISAINVNLPFYQVKV